MSSASDRLIHLVGELATPLYWMLTLIGVAYVTLSITGMSGIGGCDGPIVACDAAAYYYTAHGPYEWADAPTGVPPYRYAPTFLWIVAPLTALNFDAFTAVWAGLHVAGLLWLRAGWMLAVPGLNEDVIRGNINVFIAMLIVLALRFPVAWAPILLTKATPGVGLVWHLVRREWKALGIAVGVTVLVVAVGYAIQPSLWDAYARALVSSPANYFGVDNLLPLPIRGVAAAALVAFAAATSRAWLLPVGILVGWPGLLPPALMVLAAIPRLLQGHEGEPGQHDGCAGPRARPVPS